jgi:hypothetical protein
MYEKKKLSKNFCFEKIQLVSFFFHALFGLFMRRIFEHTEDNIIAAAVGVELSDSAAMSLPKTPSGSFVKFKTTC